MNFKKLPRSYITPIGYRLATYEEARDGLQTIKDKGLLDKWERARLLDGWITRPGDDIQIGNDFRGCMAFMLVIKPDEEANSASGTLYEDIILSKEKKEVALLLCTEDWNYEVVYWVLNSLSGSETIYPADVTPGNIPFSDPTKFKEMNTMMHDIARKFIEGGPASEKAAKRKFIDSNSVREFLSGMIGFVKEKEERIQELFSFNKTLDFLCTWTELNDLCHMSSLEGTWLGNVASQGGETWEAIADAFWNFLSESFASVMVHFFAVSGIIEICRFTNQQYRSARTSFQENFIFASYVLFYISLGRSEIIYDSESDWPEMILCCASAKAEQQPERLNQMLQGNALWRCSEETGNYEVLNKLLILASKGQALLQKGKKIDVLVINRLLECGANPGRSLRSCKSKTALHYAAKLEDEKVAKSLLERCDRNQQENFIKEKDEKGRTAFHRAAELGCIAVCKLLLHYGAPLDAQDNCGQTVLHNAVECGKEEVIDLFIENPTITSCIQLKNKHKDTPLDLALAARNIQVVAPLLWKSEKPEAYFSKVDLSPLLRQSLIKGYVKLVKLLLNKGEEQLGDDVDDEGKTTLHLATKCENEKNAGEMVGMILEKSEDKGKSVAKCDRRGRTVLHEAALEGHASLCKDLLDINPNLMNIKDKKGRNALYDAVQAKHDSIDMWKEMCEAYRKRGGKLDDVIDRSGLTPLHVAAEEGRRNIIEHLLSIKQGGRKHIKKADFVGQTALHKAAKLGDKDAVDILLKNGADPFQERDCDGRTALHYVVQAKRGEEGKELAKLLLGSCKSPEETLLFLWASAMGVGPADQNLTDPELKGFLSDTKDRLLDVMKSNNLLRIAAYIGHTGMAKELLSRGFQIEDIQNEDWQNNLNAEQKKNVKRVKTELETIAEQGNDLPTIQDNLERGDYARGLAALLLNPFLKPPITVGIFGEWGKGKSSLMIQTERILLETVAQFAILPSSQLSRSTSDFPGVKVLEWSKEGEKRSHEIKRRLDMREEGTTEIGRLAKPNNRVEFQAKEHHADSLVEYLCNYQPKYREIFKSLAVMDSSKMFTKISQAEQHSTKDFAVKRNVPAIITVQYNAWKYRNETEALAGMAVEITKEIEGSMTDPQWLTTCFRNTWRRYKYSIWIEIIFPCLLAVFLACSFIWIVWVVFDRYKVAKWAKTKYACVPAAILVIVWILTKSVMKALKPVSTQLMNYISFPDHADKLGYQDRVISDINFLKDEIGRKPSKICSAMVKLWHLVIMLKLWFAALCSSPKCLGNGGTNMKFPPAHSKDLRIIVFVDDLDRCQESVILQVLAAINIVLAVCQINVVLGMDKRMLERAIMMKYGNSKANEELAENYLQKIIQLPLDLPDPSKDQLKRFLKRHMSVVHIESDDNDTELDKDAHNAKIKKGQMRKLLSLKAPPPEGINGTVAHGTDDEDQSRCDAQATPSFSMGVDTLRGERDLSVTSVTSVTSIEEGTATFPKPTTQKTSDRQNKGKKRSNPLIPIPIREMLFVTYSSGEWDAIHYFHELATDCRKLPREWKRFLNYHRLVWNIFSINVVEKPLVGWQVQLISWIFICWEWKENMDFLIKDWCKCGVLKTFTSTEPSLGIIVEHFIQECGSNNCKEVEVSENRNGKPGKEDEVANGEQSNKDKKMTEISYQEDRAQTVEDPQGKKSRLDQPEAEKKEEMRAIKEQLHSLEKTLEDLKKTINGLKLGQGTTQVTPKHENSVNENKIKQKDMANWRRLRSVLDKYDVSMDGIQAFQRFRFHCVPGHLQWPLPGVGSL